MAEALIALGGNVGDVRQTFAQTIARICNAADATLAARSSDYETPPWGDPYQPRFVNACIAIETQLSPYDLLTALQEIERAFGRERHADRRNGPRTLDLDILAYGDVTLYDATLTLPHPRLFERAFVLVPLAEIAPDRIIAGRRVGDALNGLDISGIWRL